MEGLERAIDDSMHMSKLDYCMPRVQWSPSALARS